MFYEHPRSFQRMDDYPAGFGGFPFRRSSWSPFFDREAFAPEVRRSSPGRRPPHAPPSPQMEVDEDPFRGRDFIPIKVTHEYTKEDKKERSASPPAEKESRVSPPPPPSREPEVPRGIPSPKGKKKETHPVPSSEREVPVKVHVVESPEVGRKFVRKTPSPTPTTRTEIPITVVHEVPPAKKRVLEQISNVETALKDLLPEVESFSGAKYSKTYLYLDEMLTRELIKLDDVDVNGDEELRTKRKEAVRKIHALVDKLESKAVLPPNADGKRMQETEEVSSTTDVDPKDDETDATSVAVDAEVNAVVSEQGATPTPAASDEAPAPAADSGEATPAEPMETAGEEDEPLAIDREVVVDAVSSSAAEREDATEQYTEKPAPMEEEPAQEAVPPVKSEDAQVGGDSARNACISGESSCTENAPSGFENSSNVEGKPELPEERCVEATDLRQ